MNQTKSFSNWINESFELAKKEVYIESILEQAQQKTLNKYKSIELTFSKAALKDYRAKAKKVADKRVVESGFRLAKVLETING